MEAGLADFLTKLDSAYTVDATWAATVAHLEGLGVERVHYAYGPAQWPAGGTDMLVRRSNLPGWWLEHYAANGYNAVDPAVAHCRRTDRPLLTGPEFITPDMDPAQVRFLEESRAVGARSGIVVPLRLRHGGRRFGGFSCQTRFPRREFERWFAKVGPALQIAMFYADARVVDLMLEAEAEAVRLSPRERECLLWLAKGLRNDRIAERMGVSRPTVEMHLAHARRKLGAATREQALAKAVALGLVTP